MNHGDSQARCSQLYSEANLAVFPAKDDIRFLERYIKHTKGIN